MAINNLNNKIKYIALLKASLLDGRGLWEVTLQKVEPNEIALSKPAFG